MLTDVPPPDRRPDERQGRGGGTERGERMRIVGIACLSIAMSACAPMVPSVVDGRVRGANEWTVTEALAGSATLAAQIVVFACVLALGIALLVAIALGAVVVIRWLHDRAFGTCDDCKKTPTKKEAEETGQRVENQSPRPAYYIAVEADAIRRLGRNGTISPEDAERIAHEHTHRHR